MNNNEFINEVYEIAFGDNAINKDYTHQEVINKIREFSDTALEVENFECECVECENARKILKLHNEV